MYNILRMSCTKYIPRDSFKKKTYIGNTGKTTTVADYSRCGLNASPGRDHLCPKKTIDITGTFGCDQAEIDGLNCDNAQTSKRTDKDSFLDNCCKCEDKSLRPPKKGGSINLTKEQAKELIKQIGGKSIKSTYITYNGKDAKILGYNKYIREFTLQTNTGLENVSIKNLLVNGKRVL